MSTKRSVCLRVAAAIALGGAPFARAETHTWNGATAVFSDPAAWDGGAVPPSSAATVLTFSGLNQNYTATNDIAGGLSVNGIVFMPPTGNPVVTHSVNGEALRFLPDGEKLPFVELPAGSFYSMAANIDAPVLLDHATRFANLHQSAILRINGPITGAGHIVVDGTGTVRLSGTNTYSGGTRVLGGTLELGNGLAIGTGQVTVGGGSSVAQVRVSGAPGVPAAPVNSILLLPGSIATVPMTQEHVDSLHPSSGGIVAFNGNLNAIDLAGRNDLRIGSPAHSTSPWVYYTSITPANNTYRFGGKLNYAHDLTFDDGVIINSPLIDAPDGAPRSVNIGPSGNLRGGKIHIGFQQPANSYSGGTVVEADTPAGLTALSFNYTPQAGKTPLGTGPITVHGTLMFEGFSGSLGALANEIRLEPGSRLLFNNARASLNRWPDTKAVALNGSELVVTAPVWGSGVVTEKVGALSTRFHSKVTVGGSGTGWAMFEAALLTRVDNGTLHVHSDMPSGLRNGYVRGRVDPAPSSLSRPVSWIVGSDVNTAPTYVFQRSDGALLPFEGYAPGFVPNSSTEVVDLTSAATVNAETAWALRMRAVGDGPTPVLTIGNYLRFDGGGLMLDGTITGGQLIFQGTTNPFEGVMYVHESGAIDSRIDARAGLTKFGPGTLHLLRQNLLGNLRINQGTVALHAENALSILPTPVDVTIAPGASLDLLADQQFRHVESHGAFTVPQAIHVTAQRVRADSLSLLPNASLQIRPGAPGPLDAASTTSRVGSLTIDPTARFDLGSHALVVDDGDPGAVRALIGGGQIMSSSPGDFMTMVSLGNDKGDGRPYFTTFGGVPVDAGDVLVKYTYLGDANLDGHVSIADYLRIDRGAARGAAGWPNGDFDDSGGIDGADYFLIDQAFLGQGGVLSQIPHSAISAVPEPGIGCTAMAAGFAAAMRRRRSHARR